MFNGFTDRARRVVFLAHREAAELHHDHIGTEHLLLALLREQDGVAATVLTELGATLAAVQARILEITGRGAQPYHGHLPLTHRVRTVLNLSHDEAAMLGHRGVSTEHLLLGLLREGRSAAAQVLHALGIDIDAALAQTRLVLSRQRRDVTPVTSVRYADPPADMAKPAGPPELDARIAVIRAAKEAAVDEQDFERAAELRAEEHELLRQLRRDPPQT